MQIAAAQQRIIRVAVCVLCLAMAEVAGANGVYMPQKAYPTMPLIPQQQAIIVHRNGTETLIVESALQTDSPEVAWILPLPAVPTKLELGEPGEITAATYAARPTIIHDLHGLTSLSLVLLFLVFPFCVVIIINRDPTRQRSWFRTILLLDVIVVLFCSILLPSLGGAGPSGVSPANPTGVSIQSSRRLGDADFTVLNAANPAALSQWLNDQSLRPLDKAAGAIVQDYIGRGWCFVVGRLTHAAGGPAVPRPLVAVFPTGEPVFPMKLTALAGSTTHVELFLIADRRAAAPGFHCAAADRMSPVPAATFGRGDAGQSAFYRGSETGLSVGSPDVVSLLWPGCIVTKLTAELAPGAMDHDIIIALQNFVVGHRDTFYTFLSRRQIVLSALSAAAAVWLVIAAFIAQGRRRPRPGQLRFLIVSLSVVLLASGVTWLALPTIPVRVASRGDFRTSLRRTYDLPKAAQAMAAKGFIHAAMTPAELASLPQAMIDGGYCTRESVTNPYTGELMRPERSPGNFAIRSIGHLQSFCIYTANGTEEYTPLEAAP